MRKRYEIAYQNCDKLVVFTDAFIDKFQNIIKNKINKNSKLFLILYLFQNSFQKKN